MYIYIHFSHLEDYLENKVFMRGMLFSVLVHNNDRIKLVVANMISQKFYKTDIVNKLGETVILDLSIKPQYEIILLESFIEMQI